MSTFGTDFFFTNSTVMTTVAVASTGTIIARSAIVIARSKAARMLFYTSVLKRNGISKAQRQSIMMEFVRKDLGLPAAGSSDSGTAPPPVPSCSRKARRGGGAEHDVDLASTWALAA